MAIAKAASDKKALDIVTIDMRKMSGVCDYFIIASGTSTTHTRAVSDHIIRTLRDKGERVWHVEGEREASWILLDYGDVVAHIFLEDMRRYYSLERLWEDAPQKRFAEARRKAVRKASSRKKRAKKQGR